jgi:hypothetical protein
MSQLTFNAAVLAAFMVAAPSEVRAQSCNCDAIPNLSDRNTCMRQCIPNPSIGPVRGPAGSGGPPSRSAAPAPESTPNAPPYPGGEIRVIGPLPHLNPDPAR